MGHGTGKRRKACFSREEIRHNAEESKTRLEHSSVGIPLADGSGQCYHDPERDEYDGPDP